MESSKIMMFPEMGANNGIDPNLLLALNNNGGFGGNNWVWILFLWLIWGGAWNNGGFGGNNGAAGFLSNQLSNDTGRELLMNAIQGNRDSINSLANLLNTEISTVQNGVFALNNAINSVGTQVGMSGLQIQNAIQAGNASIASQICQCCCENRLAVANQTNALQAQYAAGQAADQLAVCQQTNTLSTQAERNTNSILNAIAGQNTLITKEFCDLKERELQNTINAQGDLITQLRGQISNDKQTEAFNNAIHALDDKIDAIAAKTPNTIPVQWPNVQAVNTTPFAGGFYGLNNGWGSNSFWN